MIGRCTECGLRIIPIAGRLVHPTCEPDDVDAARIRAEHEAHERKITGQDAAAGNDDFAVATSIIYRACINMPVWSANDLRLLDERWEHLGRYVRGTATSHASRRKWAHKTGRKDTSSSPATNEAEVHVWQSDIYVDEFAAGLLTGQAR